MYETVSLVGVYAINRCFNNSDSYFVNTLTKIEVTMKDLIIFLIAQVLCGAITVSAFLFTNKDSAKTCAGYYGVYLFGAAGTVLIAFLAGMR